MAVGEYIVPGFILLTGLVINIIWNISSILFVWYLTHIFQSKVGKCSCHTCCFCIWIILCVSI